MALTWGALAAPLDRIAAGPRRTCGWRRRLPPHWHRTTRAAVGTVELDLRRHGPDRAAGRGGTPVADEPGSTPGLGNVEVMVPERRRRPLHRVESGLGSVEFDDRRWTARAARLDVNDLGADGVASGRPLVLDVHAGVGSVEVHRG